MTFPNSSHCNLFCKKLEHTGRKYSICQTFNKKKKKNKIYTFQKSEQQIFDSLHMSLVSFTKMVNNTCQHLCKKKQSQVHNDMHTSLCTFVIFTEHHYLLQNKSHKSLKSRQRYTTTHHSVK